MAVQCLILSSGLKDYGHLLALSSYKQAQSCMSVLCAHAWVSVCLLRVPLQGGARQVGRYTP